MINSINIVRTNQGYAVIIIVQDEAQPTVKECGQWLEVLTYIQGLQV